MQNWYKKAQTSDRPDALTFSDSLMSDEQKGRRLRGNFGDILGNYVNDEGVEVTIKEPETIVYLNGEQYTGDIEIEFIGVKDVQNRNQGAASRELSRIINKADENDMSIILVVDSQGATGSGSPLGLKNNELKDWYERHGFIFNGLIGYRPRRSENRQDIMPKYHVARKDEEGIINQQLNEDIKSGTFARSFSDPDSLFDAFHLSDIPSPPPGYLDSGGGIYYFDGENRPVPVTNVEDNYNWGTGLHNVVVK